MENFSTPHCSESETHDVCVDYAMQGIFTDSFVPSNSSLISDNISILISCMHPQACLLISNISLVAIVDNTW